MHNHPHSKTGPSPASSYLSRLGLSIVKAIVDFFHYQYGFQSAALSFYLFISLIPLLVVIATLLSLLPFETPQITQTLYSILPDFPYDIQKGLSNFSSLLSKSRSLYAWVSFFWAYYLTSNLFFALHKALSRALENKKTSARRFLFQIISIPIFIMVLFVIYFGNALILVFIRYLSHLHIVTSYVPALLLTIVVNIANIISFFTFFFLLILMYHLLSARRNRKFKNTISVGLMISVIFMILKSTFGNLLSLLGHLNPVYGIFGGIFSFLLWIFITFFIILIGARTIYHLEHTQPVAQLTDSSAKI